MVPKYSLFLDYLMTLPQHLIPHHLLSRLVFKLTRLKLGCFTHWTIKTFIRYYQIDMQNVLIPEIQNYTDFNQFFTRALTPEARPLAKADLVSPVDGVVSQIGVLDSLPSLKAKNHSFQLHELLANHTDKVALFKHGLFCTIYLSPRDYHRIHLPIAGRLTDMIYVPGRLYSVNSRTVRTVPNLFSRNERVICLFATEQGPLALILIGALFVGSMETIWAGAVPPSPSSQPQHWRYSEVDAPVFQQGDEIGRFNMGSTVILLLGRQQRVWNPELAVGSRVLMGNALMTSNHGSGSF